MKRYYLSRRIGDGTHENPYNSELREYIRQRWPNEPKSIKQVIAHTCPVVLHKYDLSQVVHDDVMASLTDIFAFPEGALDRQLATISTVVRSAIQYRLERAGFYFSGFTLTNTVRDVLEYIAHSIQLSEWADVQIGAKNFDVRKTVAEIPVTARQKIAKHLANLGIDTSGITLNTSIGEVAQMVQKSGAALRTYGRLKKRPWLFYDEDTE